MSQQASRPIRIARLAGTESDHVFSAMETLHQAELSAGTLAHMPHGFLHRFYKFMASQNDLAVLGAFDGDRIVGFVCGSVKGARLSRLVGRFVTSDPHTAAATVVRLAARPTEALRIMRLVVSLIRDQRQPQIDGPQLLSIAVDRAEANRGFGSQLFEKLSAIFSHSGVREFTVIAAHSQNAALAFYKRRGCTRVMQVKLGDLPCTVFRCPVSSSSNSQMACQTD